MCLLEKHKASIIEHNGSDIFQVATSYYMISCFMTRGFGCYKEAI